MKIDVRNFFPGTSKGYRTNFSHRRHSIKIGKLWNILIYWHPLGLVMILVSLAIEMSDMPSRFFSALVSAFVLFFLSQVLILIHELGHAFVARRFKVKVISIDLFPTHGLCFFNIPYYRYQHVVIAWGGILFQLLSGGIVLILCTPLSLTNSVVAQFFLDPLKFVFGPLNVFFIVVNLLPIAPLDGKLAWQGIPLLYSFLRRRRRPYR